MSKRTCFTRAHFAFTVFDVEGSKYPALAASVVALEGKIDSAKENRGDKETPERAGGGIVLPRAPGFAIFTVKGTASVPLDAVRPLTIEQARATFLERLWKALGGYARIDYTIERREITTYPHAAARMPEYARIVCNLKVPNESREAKEKEDLQVMVSQENVLQRYYAVYSHKERKFLLEDCGEQEVYDLFYQRRGGVRSTGLCRHRINRANRGQFHGPFNESYRELKSSLSEEDKNDGDSDQKPVPPSA